VSTREELAQARRLSTKEMDEVIERATRIQESAGVTGRSVEDVKKVGKELDIEPAFIDRAMAEIQEEKARAAAASTASSALRKKIAIAIAGFGVALFAVAGVGSGSVRSAAGDAALARGNLVTVLDRQTQLVPQLLALSGGDVGGLSERVQEVQATQDVEEKTRAADKLQMALAQALGSLPQDGSPQRLSLQHEIVGATNRVATERRRYEEALAEWRTAASGPIARLGVLLHMAPAPP